MFKKLLCRKLVLFISFVLCVIFLIHAPFRDRYITFLEDKPLSENTLNTLKKHDKYIRKYSYEYDIPLEALAASLGSKINRRIYTNKLIDIVQDYVFSTQLCSNRFLQASLNSDITSRYLNFAKQDIGLGSVQVETAWNMYLLFPKELSNSERSPISGVGKELINKLNKTIYRKQSLIIKHT